MAGEQVNGYIFFDKHTRKSGWIAYENGSKLIQFDLQNNEDIATAVQQMTHGASVDCEIEITDSNEQPKIVAIKSAESCVFFCKLKPLLFTFNDSQYIKKYFWFFFLMMNTGSISICNRGRVTITYSCTRSNFR